VLHATLSEVEVVGAKKLGLLDSMFLALESRESMMHVGALIVLTPAKHAPPDFLRAFVEDFWKAKEIYPPWNLKLRSADFLTNPLQSWVEDKDVELDYHIRRSALPSPGDERELGILVSRLHSNQMDFHRPLWELHIIEGLAEGRFALYFKVHHSLMDGYTGTKTLLRSFSTKEDDRDMPLFFAHPPAAKKRDDDDHAPSLSALFEAAREQMGATRDVSRALLNMVRPQGKNIVRPLQAPKTIINRKITRNRRFATQRFSVERLKRAAKAANATLNDIVLAISSAALRRLLLELDALPSEPMIAMVPVNIRPKDDPGGGNAVGSILVSLATDVEDPLERLAAISASSKRAKEQLQGMSRNAIIQYSALLLAPVSLQTLTGSGRMRPAFNLVISNVPGPDYPLYFRGARIEASYPLSIPFQGYGLNITTFSYIDSLCFGFIGCRETLPHLQRLAVYGSEEFDLIEQRVNAKR
jgi:diacylglycerol O-acyltransferase / wax synthase